MRGVQQRLGLCHPHPGIGIHHGRNDDPVRPSLRHHGVRLDPIQDVLPLQAGLLGLLGRCGTGQHLSR